MSRSSKISKSSRPVSRKTRRPKSAEKAVRIADERSHDSRHLTAFGERLVVALQSKGMNDSDLAKALGIAQPNIHTLKYKTDRPRSATVMRIAKILGLAPEALLPTSHPYGEASQPEGTKVYLVIESKSGRQTIRLA